MPDRFLMTLPLVGLSGINGVVVGGFMAIGFGMGRTFGRLACEKIDSLEDSIAISLDSFTQKWR
jgi:hypothetical protein|tara:strand:+ start:93 stop:284 length:192 start_codon:yes stop_codon:yes gene_type:complete